jgi:DNA primase
MRFPPSLLDEIRTRLPVSQVVARKVSLKRAGREMKGLSPFKQERTPSFFVNDHKGSWFDFSSGQNGDIFKFLMLTEGLSFPEAVERLAEEAGLQVPKAGPRNVEQEDERTRLYALLEAAVRFFEAQIAGSGGTEARRYLDRRGLSADTVARFRLGYAPNARSVLKEHLAKAGFSAADMVASGMLVAGDDIPVSYDRFRHRIIFPITDLRGRVIAFGGRALDPEAPAKYLNSPETPLFHKGAVLYNVHGARAASHDAGQMIVVEGYMDVIALAQAGFAHAVAPLGTALTEDQVRLLWRMVPEPILCFDGDSAGRRAAFRAVETVLPHLAPGRSVQFAFLPDGLDPDDLIRQHGAAAFEEVLANKISPLFDVLIEREEQQGDAAVTPEQRAALEARLKALVARIGDPSVRDQYQRELRQTLWKKNDRLMKGLVGANGRRDARFAGKRRDNTAVDWRVGARAAERSRLGSLPRASALAPTPMRSNELAGRSIPLPAREALLVRTLLNHPWLLEARCEQVAELTLTAPPLVRLRDAMLALLGQNNTLERDGLRSQLTALGLEKVVAMTEKAITHRSDRFAEPEADAAEVEAGWRHSVALHERQVGLKRALAAAEHDWQSEPTEEAWSRIAEIQQQLASGCEVELNSDD